MSEQMVTIRLPLADWHQIVSDIENMCGTGRDDIEILQGAVEIGAGEVTAAEAERDDYRADFTDMRDGVGRFEGEGYFQLKDRLAQVRELAENHRQPNVVLHGYDAGLARMAGEVLAILDGDPRPVAPPAQEPADE